MVDYIKEDFNETDKKYNWVKCRWQKFVFKIQPKNVPFWTIIDRTYALEKVVETYRYVEKGMKVGSFSIKVV